MKILVLTTITALSFGTFGIADEDKAGVKKIEVKRTSIQRVECDTAEGCLRLTIDGETWTYRPPHGGRRVIERGVQDGPTYRQCALSECLESQRAIQSVDEIVIHPEDPNSKDVRQIDRLVLVTRPGQNKP